MLYYSFLASKLPSFPGPTTLTPPNTTCVSSSFPTAGCCGELSTLVSQNVLQLLPPPPSPPPVPFLYASTTFLHSLLLSTSLRLIFNHCCPSPCPTNSGLLERKYKTPCFFLIMASTETTQRVPLRERRPSMGAPIVDIQGSVGPAGISRPKHKRTFTGFGAGDIKSVEGESLKNP